MGQMLIGAFFVVLALVMFAATFDDGTTGDIVAARIFLPLFAIAGLFIVRHGYRLHKRRQSLRTEVEGGATVYIWIELDGSKQRSHSDPREQWDAEGDGDGGDGGD